MTSQEVRTLVAQLVATVSEGTDDVHETSVMLLTAKAELDTQWQKANQVAAEAQAQLVLEKRAVESGVSVADARDSAARALKKHPADVTALEVVNLPLLAPNAPAEVAAAPVDAGPAMPKSP